MTSRKSPSDGFTWDKEGAAQSSLRIGQHSIVYDATGDFYKAGLMNFNLAGTFNSRINLNLREDKGYTYGAGASFRGDHESGSYRLSTEVNKDATGASISEVMNELEAYVADGMTAEEYDYMRRAIGQRDARRYETPASKLGLLANISATTCRWITAPSRSWCWRKPTGKP